MRGIASVSVVCTHLSRAFYYELFHPSDSPDVPPRVLQWPFIRLLFQGKVGVAIFAMLTGYVCALKPIRLARAAKHQEALSTLSKSAFRRPPRLILPATCALVIAWLMCQAGGFKAASRSDSEWFRYAAPVPMETWREELWRLWDNFRWTWTDGRMEYDDHQWALLPFLKGSFIVFLMTAALIYTRFYFRLTVYLLFMAYWWQNPHVDTETFGLLMTFGTLLSDLSQHPDYVSMLANHPKTTTRLSLIPILTGLYVASFPTIALAAPWCKWSEELLQLGDMIFPANVDMSKRFASLGVMLVAYGILNNALLKDTLSNPFFLWLGRNSFAVYLIHGTLLRSVLAWLLYGITGGPWVPTVDEAGVEIPPPFLPRRFAGLEFLLVTAFWLGIVYVCAHLWTTYVDAACARLTSWLEMQFCLKDGEREDEYTEGEKRGPPLLG